MLSSIRNKVVEKVVLFLSLLLACFAALGKQHFFSKLCAFLCFLNWQDTENRACWCFYNTDPVKPAFECCAEIAHMRIMHSPVFVFKLKCKSVKL